MRFLVSIFGLVAGGGGVAAPILLGSGVRSGVSKEWKRWVDANPLFDDCVGEDGHYRVKLAFDEENATGDALYDLFFDFIDIKTGKSVGRLGQKFQGEEKFNLALTSFPGLGRWGVALQSKLSNKGWLSLTCKKINLEVVKEKQCGVGESGCVTTRDFKKFQFVWKNDRESKAGLIKQGLEIKSGNDLKWVDSFKPKAIFSNH